MLLDLADEVFLRRADIRDRLDHQHRCVHLGNRVGHDLAHIVAELRARLVQTRGIEKDELRVAFIEQTGDARARGLRLARNDGDLLADQTVGERAFAHIRAADNRNDRSFCDFHKILHFLFFILQTRFDYMVVYPAGRRNKSCKPPSIHPPYTLCRALVCAERRAKPAPIGGGMLWIIRRS